jgi:hypothetical protein
VVAGRITGYPHCPSGYEDDEVDVGEIAIEARCVGEVGSPDGWGCLERLHGWRVLDLHGTDERIGELYGTLLRDELTGIWAPMVQEMHFDRMPKAFVALLRRHDRHFRDYFDDRAMARAKGIERAMGAEPGSFRRQAWLTDLASIGPSLQLALGGTLQLDPVTGRVADRCTSIVGRDGDATVHARNLDFWGMGFWQPNATLLFVEPLDEAGRPDGHRYAHVGTVGELLAGSSGVNDAGLTVTTHLHVTRDVALVGGRDRMSTATLAWEGLSGRHDRTGASIYVLFEAVLRDASTVDEAIEVLRQHRPVGAWSFVVSDPTGERAVIATDHRDLHVARGASVNTNFYFDPKMHDRERNPARGPIEGARRRFARAEQLLAVAGPELTPEEAANILRDTLDSAVGHERAVSANSVASPDTSQSVVIVTRPSEAPVLWLADPHVTDAYIPAPFASFRGYRFDEGFAPGRSAHGELPFVEPSRDLAVVRAAYLDAMRLAHDVPDLPGAAAALRAIRTDDPGIRLMAAWASAAVGELDAARGELDRFRPDAASAHHRTLAAWLDGELLRAAGDEPGARVAWTTALHALDPDDPYAELGALLRAVLEHRVTGGISPGLPFPNLKFQDVVELRLR